MDPPSVMRPASSLAQRLAALMIAGSAPTPSLLGLPEALHRVIRGFLTSPEAATVAETCKALQHPYRNRLRSLTLRLSTTQSVALARLIGLQQALEELTVHDTELFSMTTSALCNGGARQLRALTLGMTYRRAPHRPLQPVEFPLMPPQHWNASLASLFAVDAANPEGALPALETLDIILRRWDGGPGVVAVLAQGASPRLRALSVPIEMHFRGFQPMEPEAAAAAKIVAATLAARLEQGCQSLAKLELGGFNWLTDGPLEERRRMWRVLGPTIEALPSGDHAWRGSAWESDLVAALFTSAGFSRLRSLSFSHPRIAIFLQRFRALRELAFPCKTRAGALHIVQALESAGRAPLLSMLQELTLRFIDSDRGEASAVLFQGIARLGALSTVRSLELTSDADGHACSSLGMALQEGAFPRLSTLSTWKGAAANQGLWKLTFSLLMAPCASTLESLQFTGDEEGDTTWANNLGFGIGTGILSSLKSVMIAKDSFDHCAVDLFVKGLESAAALASRPGQSSSVGEGDEADAWATVLGLRDRQGLGKSAASPIALENLVFRFKTMQDGGVARLASALSTGLLGSRLKTIHIKQASFGEQTFTGAGMWALAEALKAGSQHVARLEEVSVQVPCDGGERATRAQVFRTFASTLVEACAAHCPALRSLAIIFASGSDYTQYNMFKQSCHIGGTVKRVRKALGGGLRALLGDAPSATGAKVATEFVGCLID